MPWVATAGTVCLLAPKAAVLIIVLVHLLNYLAWGFLEHSPVTASLSFVPPNCCYHAHLSSLLFFWVFLYGILVPSQINWLVFQRIILIEVGQFVKIAESIKSRCLICLTFLSQLMQIATWVLNPTSIWHPVLHVNGESCSAQLQRRTPLIP